MSSPIQTLAELFAHLPSLPLFEICKHLNPCQLILLSLSSEKWCQAIDRGMNTRIEVKWGISICKKALLINWKFENEEYNFALCFSTKDSVSGVLIDHGSNWINFYFKDPSELESTSLKTITLLTDWYSPSYDLISVSLGSRSPEFPFRFLSLLPKGTAKSIYLQGDLEVDCGDLIRFLENVKVKDDEKNHVRNKMRVYLKMKNLVQSETVSFVNRRIKLADARFLTRESLKNMDINYGTFGANNFTSEDFNVFFKSWKSGKKYNNFAKVIFEIREDQQIEIEQVMKGLDAHFGKPRLRDRYKIEYEDVPDGWLKPTAIDLDQGYDIYNCRQQLGTVLLEKDRLMFIFILNPFVIENCLSMVGPSIERRREEIIKTKQKFEVLNRKIQKGGRRLNSSKNVEEWQQLSKSISQMERGLEETVEYKRRLDQWVND